MKKITPKKLNLIFLNKIYPFYDGIGRTNKILFVNDDNNESIRMMMKTQMKS